MTSMHHASLLNRKERNHYLWINFVDFEVSFFERWLFCETGGPLPALARSSAAAAQQQQRSSSRGNSI